VFAGGTGGIHRFMGPTGGYLLGFLPAAFLTGLAADRAPERPVPLFAAMITATAVIYALGVGWLKLSTGMAMEKALAVGCFPFLIGDAVKIAAALPIARIIRPMITPAKPEQRHRLSCDSDAPVGK